MRDPFPIQPIPALSEAIKPWADYFNLSTLPLHIHEIVIIAAFYQFIHSVVSPVLSKRLFPIQYTALSRSKRLSWDVHVVSLVQSTTINILALWVMFNDDERKNMDWQERIWGYTGGSAMIQALAAGYFLWDLIITASNVSVFGLGMLAHAISALLVYSFGFRPFVNYYSCNFILWELSSPFLNIHWFFDKLGMTGSRAQLYNGLMLIATFFSCRLVWGTYQSVLVARDVWSGLNYKPITSATMPAEQLVNATFPAQYTQTMEFVSESTSIPLWLAAIYIGSNLTLNSLNFYWFFKMIDAVRKRFNPKEKEHEIPVKEDETKAVTTGIDGGVPDLKTRPRRRTILDGEEEGDEPPPI
ncbi:TLC domain-containing protein [Biscogniauxia mediterranea]|nr:TLC domain-containing protein [Biscogniauxia mediterranea]